MSRKRRFISAVGSGYLALAANILYSMISIPLSLHYLTLPEFGLWSIVVQISGYLTLLDIGVGQSVARLLVDKKDEINGGDYGAILQAAWIVFAVQGAVIILFGFFSGHFLAFLMKIPGELTTVFIGLFTWNCLILAAMVLATPLSLVLWANQRYDLGNFVAIIYFVVNLGGLWLGFHLGWRTYSLLLGTLAGQAVCLPLTLLLTQKLKLHPTRGRWGQLKSHHFSEMFAFSRDLFIANLGAQLVSASQMVLVGRLMGVDAVAIWNVSIKLYNMAQLAVFRLFDFSGAGFAEMIVRNEHPRFLQKFSWLVSITAVGGSFFGILGALGNRSFVAYWASGKVGWDVYSDIAAGLYLAIICVTRCYTGTLGTIKQIENYKYVSLLEGVLFIAGSVVLTPYFRFVGILASSIIANLICSGIYGSYRMARYFDRPVSEVTLQWLQRPLRFAAAFAVVGFAIFVVGSSHSGLVALLLTGTAAGLAGLILAFLIGVPIEVRSEIVAFIASLWARVRRMRTT